MGVTAAARKLGLSVKTYSKWIRNARAGALSNIDVHRAQPVTDLQAEVSRLKHSRTGCRLSYQSVVTLFQRIRSAACIHCPPGEPRPPRLHDLRHTAAVHRVLAWYRSGKDVQQLLPHLATYLGHASIASTQRYLRMTPELMQEASSRFAAYAQHEAAQELDHA